ncbi:hypothetical protein RPHASCH2410_PA01300 (plasmid) [Rhizobium phaseoli Ch24-10]|nr:hypothetical protein RPHASCH2410_PA01300 [Rhizobium phaseoli Ch24-10]
MLFITTLRRMGGFDTGVWTARIVRRISFKCGTPLSRAPDKAPRAPHVVA